MPIVNLSSPVFISVTKAGRVNSGGTVGVYEANGLFTTPATIWSDQVKTSELPNPVTLDDAGTVEIWYDVKVDIREKTKGNALIRDTLNLDPNASQASVQGFNLAQNGSFEIDSTSDGQPDNWTISPYSGSSIAITENIVTDGAKALEFNTTGAGSGGGVVTSAKFPVTEGSVCSVAWSFFATNATTLNTFQIRWYDENNVLKSTFTLTMPASGSVPTAWTTYQEEVTAHAEATQGEIVLTGISSGGLNLSSKAYFDGISIINNKGIVTLGGAQDLAEKTLISPVINSPVINTRATGTAIKDEDDMVSDSDIHLVTQQSVKAYVDNRISGKEVIATADQKTIEVTGLDPTYKGAYCFECDLQVASSGVGAILLLINGDATVTNYHYRRSALTGAGELYSSGNLNTTGFSNIGTILGTYITGEFMGLANGKIQGFVYVSTFTTNIQRYESAFHYTASGVITSLGFDSSVTAIGNNSRLRVYRKNV